MAQDFTTYQDGQTALALHVVQGERDLVADCRSLARFELRGIPPMAAGAARIRVTFTVDADGLLSVSAQGAAQRRRGAASRSSRRTAFPTTRSPPCCKTASRPPQQDMQARALVEARVDADRMLLATQSALDADGDLLADDERAAIDALMNALARRRGLSDDAAVVEAATKALADGTEAFAARRMNAGIARALSGRQIESL